MIENTAGRSAEVSAELFSHHETVYTAVRLRKQSFSSFAGLQPRTKAKKFSISGFVLNFAM